MFEGFEAWKKAFYDKHCFLCQGKTETSKNPLKETVGGNFLHKECAKEAESLEPYTEGKLLPQFKKKTRKTQA